MTVAAARHRLAALISFNVLITALQAGLKTRLYAVGLERRELSRLRGGASTDHP
jgi:hypothetical protein